MDSPSLTYFEFFAGGGMARLGLGNEWKCVFANDICEKKAAAYRAAFGECPELVVDDVSRLTLSDLPGTPHLVWGSFPCQDLSLAGSGAGLAGARSGTFKPFWRLIKSMISEGRSPKLIVLENVIGALSSHGGGDFSFIVQCLTNEGYSVGAVVIDAVRFLPQSRPRLFILAVNSGVSIPNLLRSVAPTEPWHTKALRKAFQRLPRSAQAQWLWWSLPLPSISIPRLDSIIEDEPTGVVWHTHAETAQLVDLMSPLHRKKLDEAMRLGRRIVGTVYKRARPNEVGVNVQRAEIRFDQVSGCLRTPVGGSSRQIIMVVEGKRVRSRLLSPREAARLMGVPDSYPLPSTYNDAYHVFGDGLAVPVVSWLNAHILRPIASASEVGKAA